MESRIVSTPGIFGGKPIIRGMRISVEMILDLLSQDVSFEDILDGYPVLEREDILAALRYARDVVACEETALVFDGRGE